MTNKGWIGFDLDGTLALYQGWKGPHHIGEPIPAMIEILKNILYEGSHDVRIFTARVCDGDPNTIYLIEKWCLTHIGKILPITNKKDYQMVLLYDDRCIQVEHNTGRIIVETIPKVNRKYKARVAKGVDASDLKSDSERNVGSSPASGTNSMEEIQKEQNVNNNTQVLPSNWIL